MGFRKFLENAVLSFSRTWGGNNLRVREVLAHGMRPPAAFRHIIFKSRSSNAPLKALIPCSVLSSLAEFNNA
jgi:hypothetical protein